MDPLRRVSQTLDIYTRPHQGLGGGAPIPLEEANTGAGGGGLIAIPVVGGLHHRYQRLAA